MYFYTNYLHEYPLLVKRFKDSVAFLESLLTKIQDFVKKFCKANFAKLILQMYHMSYVNMRSILKHVTVKLNYSCSSVLQLLLSVLNTAVYCISMQWRRLSISFFILPSFQRVEKHINMGTKRSCQLTPSLCLLEDFLIWKKLVRNQNLNS